MCYRLGPGCRFHLVFCIYHPTVLNSCTRTLSPSQSSHFFQMSLGSTSARTIPWAGQAHRYNVNAPGQQPQIAISGFLPTPILVPQVPLVDTK